MNWELITKNYSRKAAVVIIAIAALTYIGVLQAEAGNQIDQELAKRAIYGIVWIGTCGIVAQGVLDWRKPKEEPEDPAAEETEQGGD